MGIKTFEKNIDPNMLMLFFVLDDFVGIETPNKKIENIFPSHRGHFHSTFQGTGSRSLNFTFHEDTEVPGCPPRSAHLDITTFLPSMLHQNHVRTFDANKKLLKKVGEKGELGQIAGRLLKMWI